MSYSLASWVDFQFLIKKSSRCFSNAKTEASSTVVSDVVINGGLFSPIKVKISSSYLETSEVVPIDPVEFLSSCDMSFLSILVGYHLTVLL